MPFLEKFLLKSLKNVAYYNIYLSYSKYNFTLRQSIKRYINVIY